MVATLTVCMGAGVKCKQQKSFFFFILLFKYYFYLMEEVNEGRKFSSAFFNQFRWPAVSHINFTKDQWGKTCNSLGKQITSKRTKVAHL